MNDVDFGLDRFKWRERFAELHIIASSSADQ